MKTAIKLFLSVVSLLFLGCEGIADGIYDTPSAVLPAEGQIVVDASDWGSWYYIDLPALHSFAQDDDNEALINAQTNHVAYPIPMTLTAEPDGKSGQYMYWFDVWGVGTSNNEFRSFTPCDAQPEPEEWTFAVHRNNVRTNGGAVYETIYTSMDELPESSAAFKDVVFTADEWSETDVWDSQEQMLQSLVPSQGIAINKVLSSWLVMNIPPMPPTYTHNNHVFILKLADGSCAALQLANYISSSGTKCYLTINYKYPY
ncbi:MAG: HmuY family protein [Prevotella sp.]